MSLAVVTDAPDETTAPPRWIGLSDRSAVAEILPSWRDCHAADPAASFYLHPDWVLDPGANPGKPPLVYVHRHNRSAGSTAMPSLAVLAEKAIRVRLAPGLPWRLTLTGRRLVGNQVLGDNSGESLATFLDEVARILASGRTDCVLFENIEVESPLWEALSRAGRRPDVAVFYPGRPQPRWWIDFPDDPAQYWEKFSSKTRNTLRRKAKKLDHSVICYTSPEDVPTFLEQARRVSRATWQTQRLGLRVKNSPEEQRFWTFAATQGAMRCYLLEHNGQPLAFVLGLQWNDRFIYEEAGYALDHADYSPGTVLLYRVLQDLTIRQSPRTLDFEFGDRGYKRLFATRQTWSGPVLLVRRHWRPLAAMRLSQLQRDVRGRARSVVRSLGLKTIAQKMFRGQF